jgi:hypothetical protein
MNKDIIIGWWSAGITSAVACKYALEMYDNVKLYYIHIDSAHKDNERFKRDCESWYGVEIESIQSSRYKDQYEVIKGEGAVNTPMGAPCTKILKKEVRHNIEALYSINLFNDITIAHQVWGFEFNKHEVNRAIRFAQQYPNTNPLFPLIEKGIDKNMCAGILLSNNIELPAMYKMGYSNNNCIGCIKAGKGYWNKIRVDFPFHFNRMANLEREVGYSCINGTFLDELDPKAGRIQEEVIPNCGIICDVEFADIPDVSLDAIMNGEKTIYDVINRKQIA